MHVRLCTKSVPGAHCGQKRELDTLEATVYVLGIEPGLWDIFTAPLFCLLFPLLSQNLYDILLTSKE